MQEKGYRAWLAAQEKREGGPYKQATVDTYIRDAKRVERVYGKNLDELYVKDCLAQVLEELEDAAKARKQDFHLSNPKRFYGPGYRSAVDSYRKYRKSAGESESRSAPCTPA